MPCLLELRVWAAHPSFGGEWTLLLGVAGRSWWIAVGGECDRLPAWARG